MLKSLFLLSIFIIPSYIEGNLPNESSSFNSFHNLTQNQNNNSFMLNEPFVPSEPFTLDYGIYCLKDSGNTIKKYFNEMIIHYSSQDNAYVFEAPYMVYVSEEERFYRDKYENTVTHEITYGATHDLWATEYNPQPHITRINCFYTDVYQGDTYVMRPAYTVDGTLITTNSYYYQNIKITLNPSLPNPFNNVHFSVRQYLYCSGIKTVTTQQTIGGVTYNVTTLGDPIITKSGTWDQANILYYPDSYGSYFLSTINCSGLGNDTDRELVSSKWQEVKEYYEALPSVNQAVLRVAEHEFDADMKEALRRYDYCLFFKNYPLEDFLNRGELVNRYYQNSSNPISIFKKEDEASTFIIIIASTISLLSITILSILLVRKRAIAMPTALLFTKLNQIIRGWINYFHIGSMKRKLMIFGKWLRHKVRVVILKKWKRPRTIYKNLMSMNKTFKCNFTHEQLLGAANARQGLYSRAKLPIVNFILSPKVLAIVNKKKGQPGLVMPLEYYLSK